ncbi:MAG: peptidoglycan editing factor PgeF [Gammaproteobacteria bacterium]|jgi:YfiH family protein|nr:peptidoglycan editing factor PgeF [Gammaproteobacteria bacterium]
MLEILKDPYLETLSSIEHGFFTRFGGVSKGIYASLNTCFESGDLPDNVRENRRRIMAHFHYPYEALVSVKNVHDAGVVVVESTWPDNAPPISDAMVTKQKNIVLGTDTADCACVLFADEIAGVVGLCHAGWKGAKKGIIANTLYAMQQQGATFENISAAISPCIAKQSYEVSHDFYQSFIDDDEQNQLLFTPSINPHHYQFDLRQFVKNKLEALRLKNIAAIAIDTYSDERFFSYRRTTHRKDTDFGGHFSCIALK